MAVEHSRAGIAHDLSHLLADGRLVAVNRTLATGRFVIAKWTVGQATVGIILQLGTVGADCLPIGVVMLATVQADHGADHLLFVTNTHGAVHWVAMTLFYELYSIA